MGVKMSGDFRQDRWCPDCAGTGVSKCHACNGRGAYEDYAKVVASLPTIEPAVMELIAMRKEIEFWRRMYSEKGMKWV